MHFDPNNNVVKLCAKGMELEASQPEQACKLFLKAWNEANSDFEKFTAAHYVARHQQTVDAKLKWDETALEFALKINDEDMVANYPSLYLNIAKCYEDLNDPGNASKNYQNAIIYLDKLPENGYGMMIKTGIEKGIERVSKNLRNQR